MKNNGFYDRIKHEMKQQTVINGQLITYYEFNKGKDKNVIFLHGWRSNSQAWNLIVSKLNQLYSIYAIDLPGFGQSATPKKPFSVADYAEVIKDFIINKGLKEVILVGHSVGGRIAIKLAATEPRIITKLILVDSAGFVTENSKKKMIKGIAKLVKPIFKPKFMSGLRKRIYKTIGAEDYVETPELKETFLKIINEDLTKHLSKIKQETLIIWGEKDAETPLSFARKMNENIKGSKLIVLKEAGHFSFIDQPEEFVKELTEFIGK